jgi:uncharacterized protein YbbC (DUF1343 family)
VLAHAASIDSEGRHAVDLLRSVPGLHVERLFAPEHGLYGHEQDMEAVAGTTDAPTGLPVFSLYGSDAASLRPQPHQLAGLDAVVFDCQDVGSRYYTYVATLSYLMESARDAGVRIVVLDRPNPIDGVHVEGPVLTDGLASFVGPHSIPVRHGMTTGELARLVNESYGIGCDLHVLHMDGWQRPMLFHETSLPWVPPSPNMPTLSTALVYPGGCLIEGTNLSEGRGTTTPFELAGAPWLDGARLADALRQENLPGVVFRACSFRPAFQKHASTICSGVQVIVRDADRFKPFSTYLVLLREARRLAPDAFRWRTAVYEFEKERLAIDLLLGREELRPSLERGAALDEMEDSWAAALDSFLALRAGYLSY